MTCLLSGASGVSGKSGDSHLALLANSAGWTGLTAGSFTSLLEEERLHFCATSFCASLQGCRCTYSDSVGAILTAGSGRSLDALVSLGSHVALEAGQTIAALRTNGKGRS